MDFGKISVFSIFSFLIISCSQKNDMPVVEESLNETDVPITDEAPSDGFAAFGENRTLQRWLNFYQQENPDLKLENFEFLESKKLETMKGTVSGIFDPEFDSVYLSFLIYNPSKTMYLDLDSYHWTLDKDGNALFEAGQEIDLVNLKDKTVTRVAFFGPPYWAEDAFWVTDSAFVLLQNSDRNEAGFQLFNLKENSVSTYSYSEPLKIRDEFYNDSRLKNKGIKVLQ